jgi:hypothetical protein
MVQLSLAHHEMVKAVPAERTDCFWRAVSYPTSPIESYSCAPPSHFKCIAIMVMAMGVVSAEVKHRFEVVPRI